MKKNTNVVLLLCAVFFLNSCGLSEDRLRSTIEANVLATVSSFTKEPSSTAYPTPTPYPATEAGPTPTPEPPKFSKSGQVMALRSAIISYTDWKMHKYLDGFDIQIKNNYITITLAKSPLTEAEFKEVAYELICLTAYHSGAGPNPYGGTPIDATDWNITGVRVISRVMADYTIVGYVEGHDNLAKMAEKRDTRWMVTIDKYYE